MKESVKYERDGYFFRETTVYQLKDSRQYSKVHDVSVDEIIDFLNREKPGEHILKTTKLTSSQIDSLDNHFNINK